MENKHEKQVGLFGGEEPGLPPQRRRADVEKRRAQWQAYKARHRDRVRAINRNSARRWYLPNLAKKFGVPVSVLRDALSKPCGICGLQQADVIDHDPQTGKFRGGLCRQCNAALGRLGDNITGVKRALAYLQRTTTKGENH